MSIGRKLRRLREIYEEKNGGESKLAYIAQEILGVENYVLLNYETIKQNPPMEALEKLSKFYDVSLEYLLSEEDIPNVKIENQTIEELEITINGEALSTEEKEIFVAAGEKAILEFRAG